MKDEVVIGGYYKENDTEFKEFLRDYQHLPVYNSPLWKVANK